MIDVLLDTNIVLYTIEGQEKYVQYLETIGTFGISAISVIELFVGAHDQSEQKALAGFLRGCEIESLDQNIAFAVADTLRMITERGVRSALLADTVIAHTALSLGVPLVTNNPKDFARFKGLKLLVP